MMLPVLVVILGIVLLGFLVGSWLTIKRQFQDHNAGDHRYCGPFFPCQP